MLSLSVALLFVSSQASPQPDVQALAQVANRTADAYLQCYRGESTKLAVTGTPEAGAATIFAACAAQREAMEKNRFELNSALYPPEVAASMREETENSNSEKAIAAGIRLDRANKANQQCISAHIEKLAATVTPEAGADTVFNACAAQREAHLKAWGAVVGMRSFQDEWQIAMVEHYKNAVKDKKEIAAAKKEIADAVRKHRGEAPAPAPAQ